MEDLVSMISSKTRLVAITASSNILGSILPVKDIVKAVRTAGRAQQARKLEVSVDCVAYAAHRRIDVQDWDVDYCVFSFYKVWFIRHQWKRIANSLADLWTSFLSVVRTQDGTRTFSLEYHTRFP